MNADAHLYDAMLPEEPLEFVILATGFNQLFEAWERSLSDGNFVANPYSSWFDETYMQGFNDAILLQGTLARATELAPVGVAQQMESIVVTVVHDGRVTSM